MKTLRPRILRLTPYAWAKLLRLRDLGPTEVGGFGVSCADDYLLVQDICLLPQRCTTVTVEFDDVAVADYFDRQVDAGLAPERFARIWIHTHPGNSAQPSSTGEATFTRCFGNSDWAIMFILARGGQTYARLRFRAGPGGALELPVEVDFERPFPAADPSAWDEEYAACVQEGQLLVFEPRALRDRSRRRSFEHNLAWLEFDWDGPAQEFSYLEVGDDHDCVTF